MANDRFFKFGLPIFAVAATAAASVYGVNEFTGGFKGLGPLLGSTADSPEEAYVGVIADHPEAEIVWKEVPDDENGYLMIERLSNGGAAVISDEFSNALAGQAPWDSKRIDILLRTHAPTVEVLTKIGYLRNQSCAYQKDAYRLPDAKWVRNCGDLLIADARRKAEKGNFEHARARIYAAMGLASHFSQIETPSVLHLTAAMMTRYRALDVTSRHILSLREFSHDELRAWRAALAGPTLDATSLARSLRADAWTGSRTSVIEADEESQKLSKRKIITTSQGSAEYLLELAALVEDAPLKSLNPDSGSAQIAAEVSPPRSEAVEAIAGHTVDWLKKSTRIASLHALHFAAIDLAIGETPTVEPISGRPFVFRRKSYTISQPSVPMFMDPLPESIPVPKVRSEK